MTSVYTTGRKKVPRYTLLTPEVVGNRLVNALGLRKQKRT